jgi:hypothetical protein
MIMLGQQTVSTNESSSFEACKNITSELSETQGKSFGKPSIALVVYFGFILLAYFGIKEFLLPLKQVTTISIAYFLALGLFLLLGAYRIGYAETPPAFRILLRACSLIFTVYCLFNYYSLPIEKASLAFFAGPLKWLTVGLGLLAIRRPYFAIFPVLYTIWEKRVYAKQSRFGITSTDYIALVDFALLLILGYLFLQLFQDICRWVKKKPVNILPFLPTLNALVYCAVTAHLSNYFYSGVQKLVMDHSFSAWFLENQTNYLILNALWYGLLPISKLLAVFPGIYTFTAQTIVLANLFSLLSQLLVIIAVLRIRWMIGLTLLLDVFHIGVFLLSGIFFWKWMLLNFAIVLAMRLYPQNLPRWYQVAGVLIVLISPFFFYTAKLGWYDTRSSVKVSMQAVTQEGKVYAVPSNYFLGASVAFAQNLNGKVQDGHFPVGVYGTVSKLADMKKSNACALSLTENKSVPEHQMKRLEKLIRNHHRFVIENASTTGQFDYDLFPHHIWSNPLEYTAFKSLDKRQINAYRLVVESACLDYKDGRLVKDVKATSFRNISL